MKSLLVAAALAIPVLGSLACAGTLPPTIQAIECNQLCAHSLTMGDLQTAEDQCDLGLQYSPQYANLWVNKGIIAKERAQFDKAKEYFIKALRLNQHQAQAYNNLGMLYMKELAFGKAHDNFERALSVNPGYPDARYNLALAWIALKDFEKAKKQLRTLLQLQPDLADAWGQLGQIALNEGEDEVAIDYLTKATQLAPTFIAAWLSLGNAFMEVGKPCDGKDAYSTCIEYDQAKVECRNNIIIAEKKCALQEKALEDAKGRLAGTKTPETEYADALQAKDKGLVNDEERSYKRCLKYDPKFVQCHYGLFELYRSRSDEKNAITACKNFIKFASETEFATQVATCHQFVRD
jgi:Flp pilus assembly protein TadD